MLNRFGARRTLVTGAGGFIGHHLVKFLKSEGCWVRGVDLKRPEFEASPADEFFVGDLRSFEQCQRAVDGVEDVYQLAADMGGIGYITSIHASLSRNNILINSHMLEASRLEDVERYFYSSSACVYPSFLQKDGNHVRPLREQDATPADPEIGYGWEKLFAEQLTSYFCQDYGLDVRIARFHNVYGPMGAYEGGREKSPAAICRKVAEAVDGSAIEVWGDGNQIRTYCYVEDCVDGILRIMNSGFRQPLNLGSGELVTIDQLVDLVCSLAGKKLQKTHVQSKPQGVRGRSSDNTLLRSVLDWEPHTPLMEGLRSTYEWIWHRLVREGRSRPPAPAQAFSSEPLARLVDLSVARPIEGAG
jgi:GDP-D-mannose 3', 5'-epimerase